MSPHLHFKFIVLAPDWNRFKFRSLSRGGLKEAEEEEVSSLLAPRRWGPYCSHCSPGHSPHHH